MDESPYVGDVFEEWTFLLPPTGGDPTTVVRRAVASAGPEPARRGRWLAVLAVLLERHYRRCGDAADLDEAVAAGRAAVELLPVADEGRAAARSALAGALALRFRLRGRLTDLGEALALSGPAGAHDTAVLPAWARFRVSGVTSPDIPGTIRRRGEDLRGIRLCGQWLRFADLGDADLTGADLTDADLTGANLAGARLVGARLGGAVLTGTVLCGADLTGAWLPDTDLRTAELTGAVLRRAMLLGATLPPDAERTLTEGGAAWRTAVGTLPARRRRGSRVAPYFRDVGAWLPPVVAADAGVAGLVATVDAAGVMGLWDAAARVPLRWIDDTRRLEHWHAEALAKARTDIWDTGDGWHADHTVLLSPDGTTVARITSTVSADYACLDHSLVVWLFDTATGRPIGWHACAESEEPEEGDPPRRVSAAFSPDGRQLAVAGSYDDVEVVHVPSGPPPESDDDDDGDGVPAVTVAWRGRHPEWAVVDGPLRYSPDGRRLAVAGRPFAGHHATAAVWELDPRTGAELFHAEAGGDHVLALGHLPDGRLAVVSGGPGYWSGRLWRTDEPEPSDPAGSLSVTEPIACAAFAPDGGSVALAYRDGAVEVRDLPSWRRRWRSPAGPAVTGLRFSPDATTLAGTGTDLGTGVPADRGGRDADSTGVPAGDSGMSAGYGVGTGIANGTRVWDTASGVEWHRSARTALAFTADGRFLITAGGSPTLVDARSGAPAGSLDPEPADADGWRLSGLCLFRAGAVADDPPGRPETGPLRHEALLVVGQWSWVPEPPRWRPGGSSPGRLKVYEEACVAWSPDGRLLAVAWTDQVFLWPLDGLDTRPLVIPPPDPTVTADSGDDRFTVSYRGDDQEEDDEILAVAFAPDGASVAATHESGAVRFWRVADPGPAGPGLDGAVVTAFSPDGRLLAGGGADGELRLWHLPGPVGAGTVHAHEGAVRQLAFAPDGTLLATGGEDGLVRLWDPRTLAPVGAPLPGPGGAVAFSPADGTLLTGDADGRVRRWNARTGEPLGPPFGDRPTTGPSLGGYHGRRDNTALVEAVAASVDGRIVATRHDNSGVGLWDPVSGESLVPEGTVLAGTVAFAPGGDLVFVGGYLYHVAGPR